MKRLFFLLLLVYSVNLAFAQTYSIEKLSQEPISGVKSPMPLDSKEVGDTTFTLYTGSSVEIKAYFVHGDQYDNIFNPNPTGLYLNGQHFNFYCSQELSFLQHVNMFLDIKEFDYLGKTYLVIINLWENCKDETCRYRCYNVFDLSDKKSIKQYSFNSIFEGIACFGEFNNDGVIDYVRVAPKVPEGLTLDEEQAKQYYLITAYSLVGGKSNQLSNASKNNYYILAKGDEDVQQFSVLAADWFFPMKDAKGADIEPKAYFPPYISFDPSKTYLFDEEGFRIEKNRWSVLVRSLSDIEGAKDLCADLKKNDFNEVYILPDQYSGKIKFQVLVGNYQSKDAATDIQEMLAKIGFSGDILDLRIGYK